jgi:hypothetical protein
MPGLVPGIHVFFHRIIQDVDGRDKRGHDEMIRCGASSYCPRYLSKNLAMSLKASLVSGALTLN